jgi:hypothetical protein
MFHLCDDTPTINPIGSALSNQWNSSALLLPTPPWQTRVLRVCLRDSGGCVMMEKHTEREEYSRGAHGREPCPFGRASGSNATTEIIKYKKCISNIY